MSRHPPISGYVWENAALNDSHNYLLPALNDILTRLAPPPRERRLFDLGCGNGSVANELVRLGWEVTGVDPSEQGIAQANAHFPHIPLFVGSAYDDLAAQYGTFPVVVSLEVVEHLYAPRLYAATLYKLLEPGGGSHCFHALSRLSEELGVGHQRYDGRTLYRTMGSRPHQVLVNENSKSVVRRGRFQGHSFPPRRPNPALGKINDCYYP